jgi:hypothetical protein
MATPETLDIDRRRCNVGPNLFESPVEVELEDG